MPLPIFRYQEDRTGVNTDNLIIGEVHELQQREIRVVVPKHGPVFSESIAVIDDTTNQQLVNGIDYKVAGLVSFPTEVIGKEIVDVILIINQDISAKVRINYQCLGGLWSNDSSNIYLMYDAAMRDERPIDWENILHKPYEYPPGSHLHRISDVYGFEYLVAMMERLSTSIQLRNVPAFEEIIEWVKRKYTSVSEQEIIDSSPVAKIVTFDKLLFALKQLNFNGITLSPTLLSVKEGAVINFSLSSTNLDDNTLLYWTIEHITTKPTDFNLTSGIINMVGNRGQFTVPVATNNNSELYERFKVAVRKNGTKGPILTSTSIITIGAHKATNMLSFLNACCPSMPGIERSAASVYTIIGKRIQCQEN